MQAALETSKATVQSLEGQLQVQKEQKDRCDDGPLGSTMGGWYREMEQASFASRSFHEESLQKELDEAKSATSSTEASKDALETEVQQQKDALATLEEKLQEQKQLAEAQQEAKLALEAKLQDTQTSKSEMEAGVTPCF